MVGQRMLPIVLLWTVCSSPSIFTPLSHLLFLHCHICPYLIPLFHSPSLLHLPPVPLSPSPSMFHSLHLPLCFTLSISLYVSLTPSLLFICSFYISHMLDAPLQGRVSFTSTGDRIAETQIEQMQNGVYHEVGTYDYIGDHLDWYKETVRWPNGLSLLYTIMKIIYCHCPVYRRPVYRQPVHRWPVCRRLFYRCLVHMSILRMSSLKMTSLRMSNLQMMSILRLYNLMDVPQWRFLRSIPGSSYYSLSYC